MGRRGFVPAPVSLHPFDGPSFFFGWPLRLPRALDERVLSPLSRDRFLIGFDDAPAIDLAREKSSLQDGSFASSVVLPAVTSELCFGIPKFPSTLTQP